MFLLELLGRRPGSWRPGISGKPLVLSWVVGGVPNHVGRVPPPPGIPTCSCRRPDQRRPLCSAVLRRLTAGATEATRCLGVRCLGWALAGQPWPGRHLWTVPSGIILLEAHHGRCVATLASFPSAERCWRIIRNLLCILGLAPDETKRLPPRPTRGLQGRGCCCTGFDRGCLSLPGRPSCALNSGTGSTSRAGPSRCMPRCGTSCWAVPRTVPSPLEGSSEP